MAKKRTLRVGLIGYKFMGKAHSNAYRQAPRFFDLPVEIELATLCGRSREGVEQAASKLGWGAVSTDWREVVDDPTIDIIDVSTPGDSHAEIAIAAAQAGKAVFCEKPLANTLDEARAMLRAVESARVTHALFHNYRKAPAVALAKRMLDEGRLGRVFHFRATYLQDWIIDPNFPLVWRLLKEHAGSGALGDIGSHIVDLSRYLIGEISEVVGSSETFIRSRPLPDSPEQFGEVTVDDAASFLARFDSGAMGTFEASRFALGRKNFNRFEINGSEGSLAFNLERMNELEFCDGQDAAGEQGFRVIQATDPSHPYIAAYWPPGHIVGYEHTFLNLVADAVTAVATGTSATPDFRDGVANQAVLDAVERSVRGRSWQSVNIQG